MGLIYTRDVFQATFFCRFSVQIGLIWLLMSIGQTVYAQKQLVTGKIISADDQLPIIGVSILERGTSNGTLSDTEGVFKLDVTSPKAVLVFSYVGMENVEMPLNGQTTLSITMGTSNALLKDVVVTGYRKEIRSDVSTAIASIKSKDIEKLVVIGIDQALQGQASGVDRKSVV